MIAVDTSAIVAILWREPDADQIRRTLSAAGSGILSTANAVELQIVTMQKALATAWDDVEDLFKRYHIALRPFDEQQLAIAREAALRFGKGRHKAALNFGDCFAYALAKSEDVPLLCKGRDFAHTDLTLA